MPLGVQIGGQIAIKQRRLFFSMRKILTTTEVEPLSDTEKKCFLSCHIPYRLEFLRRGSALASNSGVRDPAIVEAALMSGRQLIQFLGLTVKFRKDGQPDLTNEKSEEYQSYKRGGVRYTDEVKIVNLGGEFQKRGELDQSEATILADFVHAANKSTAHLTEGSGHRLWDNGGDVFYKGCGIITRLVEDARKVAESKLPS
jgi:hypothetical protein